MIKELEILVLPKTVPVNVKSETKLKQLKQNKAPLFIFMFHIKFVCFLTQEHLKKN